MVLKSSTFIWSVLCQAVLKKNHQAIYIRKWEPEKILWSHINGSKRQEDEQCARAEISMGKQRNPNFFCHVL